MKTHMLVAALSVLLVPSLTSTAAPAPASQTRGTGRAAPTQSTVAREPHGKPDAVWVEGHSRSGIFVPGHWQ